MEICICSGHHHIKSYRNDTILNPCADSAVDIAIAEAPQQLDPKFLTKLQPDYVVVCLAMEIHESIGM